MKNLIHIVISLIALSSIAFAQSSKNAFGSACLKSAKEVAPTLSTEARSQMETQLAEAKTQFDKNLTSADAIIWLGRRTAYLGRYKEAIEIYTRGIEKHPQDARLYRHRGHRFISLRCFDAAIADFEKAAKLIKGKPDEIEPDGQPNARNVPTSTLQSNIWYHLGLVHYLKGDFKTALRAYRECLKVSKNPDMLVATTHWLYMTLRRLNRNAEANKTLTPIKENMDIIENHDYYKLLLMYRGKSTPQTLLDEIKKSGSSLSNASVGYGVGNWFLYNHQRDEALKIFREITSGPQWSSFGFIAAEVELKR
jgi:tetratricopeptide (TPR) repeat protein